MINETKMLSLLKKKERVFYERHREKHLVATPYAIFALRDLSPRVTAKLVGLGMDLAAEGPQEVFEGVSRPGPSVSLVFMRPEAAEVDQYYSTRLCYHTNGTTGAFLVSPTGETVLVQSPFLAPFCDNHTPWQVDSRLQLVRRRKGSYSPVWVSDGTEDIALIMPVKPTSSDWANIIQSHVEEEGNKHGMD